MVLSFEKKGNTQARWGTWGSPFGMCGGQAAARLNDGAWPLTKIELAFDHDKAGDDCDASKLDFRKTEVSGEG